MGIQAFLIALLLGTVSHAGSDVSKVHAITEKTGNFVEKGVIIGGTAGTGFTLLKVRRHFTPETGLERVVLDLGELNGQPLHNFVSFFQVNVAEGWVNLDLAQMHSAGFTQEQVDQVFRRSHFVSQVSLSYDPEDLSTNLKFKVKEPIKVEVFKLLSADKPSRIVMDFLKI